RDVRGRPLQGEVQAVESAIAELELPQLQFSHRLVSLARVEVDAGVDRFECDACVMDARAVYGCAEGRIIQCPANSAAGLQLSAAVRRDQAQIFRLDAKAQVELACGSIRWGRARCRRRASDASVEGDVGSAQSDADAVEFPRSGGTRQSAATARRDAAQPASDVAHLQIEIAGARETPLRGHVEAEGTGEIATQVSGIHVGEGAVDDPL